MTPAEKAAEVCKGYGGDFRDEVEAFMLTGYVFSTPELFVMGKPVPKGAKIVSPWGSWPLESCDAWYIWLAVSSRGLLPLLELMPFPLPFVGFHREGRGRS